MPCPRFTGIDDSGKPKTAYFTADMADAIEHGRAMAAARAAEPGRDDKHRLARRRPEGAPRRSAAGLCSVRGFPSTPRRHSDVCAAPRKIVSPIF
jgi:hypothetical protein